MSKSVRNTVSLRNTSVRNTLVAAPLDGCEKQGMERLYACPEVTPVRRSALLVAKVQE